MAVRQYIGARYVPEFSDVNGGIWDSSYTYESLTIVKHGNDYYTSRQAVPTGIDITNSNYWVLTGNYNGAITELDNKISINSDRIDTVEEDIGSLDEKIDAVDDRVDVIDAKIDHINARKMLFMGDSYNNIWPNQGWDRSAGNCLGLSAENRYFLSSGGYAFTRSSYKFLTLLQTHISEIPNKDTFTDIIVCAGANEDSTQADMTAAIGEFKEYCKAQFPNAILRIGFIGWSGQVTIRNRMIANEQYYVGACNALGIPYLHNVQYVLHNYEYLFDNRAVNPYDYHHPTVAGNEALGRAIAQAIMTGSCTVRYEEALPIVSTGATNSIVNGDYIAIIMENGAMRIDFPSYFSLNPITVNRGDTLELGTFTSNLFRHDHKLPFASFAFSTGSPLFDVGYMSNTADENGVNTISVNWRGQNRSAVTGGLMLYGNTISIDSMRN